MCFLHDYVLDISVIMSVIGIPITICATLQARVAVTGFIGWFRVNV